MASVYGADFRADATKTAQPPAMGVRLAPGAAPRPGASARPETPKVPGLKLENGGLPLVDLALVFGLVPLDDEVLGLIRSSRLERPSSADCLPNALIAKMAVTIAPTARITVAIAPIHVGTVSGMGG